MRMPSEYLQIFIICGFLVGLSVSFSTNICSHDDLVQKTKESFQCDREFHARIFQNARENAGNDGFCEIMKERVNAGCYNTTVGACANGVEGGEASTMLTWFFMNNFTRCDKELKQKEIEEEAQRILAKYKGNYTALYNLIKYDNANCSLQGRRKSFRKLIPCSIPEVLKGLSGLKYGDKGLESLPACNLISNVLENCFDENECYSQREMDYGRNLIAAYYIHNMNSLRDNTGYPQAVKNFLKRFDGKKVLESMTRMTERVTNLIIDNMQLIINDYESDACQESITKFNSLVI